MLDIQTVLQRLNSAGIKCNRDLLESYISDKKADMARAEGRILYDTGVMPNNSKGLLEYFVKRGFDASVIKKSVNDHPMLTRRILTHIAETIPEALTVRSYKDACRDKICLKKLLEKVKTDRMGSRVHPDFMIDEDTGRIKGLNALNNWPELFIPDNGMVFVEVHIRHLELYMLAMLAQDGDFIKDLCSINFYEEFVTDIDISVQEARAGIWSNIFKGALFVEAEQSAIQKAKHLFLERYPRTAQFITDFPKNIMTVSLSTMISNMASGIIKSMLCNEMHNRKIEAAQARIVLPLHQTVLFECPANFHESFKRIMKIDFTKSFDIDTQLRSMRFSIRPELIKIETQEVWGKPIRTDSKLLGYSVTKPRRNSM